MSVVYMGKTVEEWLEGAKGQTQDVKDFAQALRDDPRRPDEGLFGYRLRCMFFDEILERLK